MPKRKPAERTWKPGRGKLGPLAPLLGDWIARGESPRGPFRCHRSYVLALDGSVVLHDARWVFPGFEYLEHAVFAPGEGGALAFWSFTSDGKRSTGRLARATGLPKGALCFEAQMKAGLARQLFWPESSGFGWAVEARSKTGWKRFVEHSYRPA